MSVRPRKHPHSIQRGHPRRLPVEEKAIRKSPSCLTTEITLSKHLTLEAFAQDVEEYV